MPEEEWTLFYRIKPYRISFVGGIFKRSNLNAVQKAWQNAGFGQRINSNSFPQMQ